MIKMHSWSVNLEHANKPDSGMFIYTCSCPLHGHAHIFVACILKIKQTKKMCISTENLM